MATEGGLFWAAVWAAAPAIVAGQAANSFQIPTGDYEQATILSLIGIIGRHCYDASAEGHFNLRKLAFDIPTAPMLGILGYTACLYFNVADVIRVGVIVLGSFLGPDWIRSLGTGLADLLLKRLAGRTEKD